jgi:hypothetical protein
MGRVKYTIITTILLSALPIFASADVTKLSSDTQGQSGALRVIGPLDATEKRVIQHVSRSVLTAKRGYTPDAEQLALRDALKGLSAAIDATLAPQPGSNLRLLDSTAAANAAGPRPAGNDRFAGLRARLATVHAHRQKIESNVKRTKRNLNQPQTEDLAAKVAEMALEADAALNATGDERISRLHALRARLQARSLRETGEEQFEQAAGLTGKPAPGKGVGAPGRITPTISTLVRHH